MKTLLQVGNQLDRIEFVITLLISEQMRLQGTTPTLKMAHEIITSKDSLAVLLSKVDSTPTERE